MSAVFSLIRNLLLAIGSGGVVAGHFSEQDWATIVSALLIVASAVWKWIERRRRESAEG